MKIGQKANVAAKMGQKSINVGSKIGAKAAGYVQKVSPLLGLAAPEIALPVEIGAMVSKPVFKSLEKATRK